MYVGTLLLNHSITKLNKKLVFHYLRKKKLNPLIFVNLPCIWSQKLNIPNFSIAELQEVPTRGLLFINSFDTSKKKPFHNDKPLDLIVLLLIFYPS